jgi:Ca2+-binding EF-hand superfamily protein
MLHVIETDAELKRDLTRAAMKIIMAADTNGDHSIDKLEASAFVDTSGHDVSSALLQHIEDIDVDKDGAINLVEMVRAIVAAAAPQVQSLEGKLQYEAAKVLAAADTNDDQALDRTELNTFMQVPGHEPFKVLFSKFDSYDTDGSQSLSFNELTNLLLDEARPEARAQPVSQQANVAEGTSAPVDEKFLLAAQRVMEQGDTDKNASLSMQEVNALVSRPGHEFLAGISSRFESFDEDGSGSLDVKELSKIIRALS